jgi:hypothetical protein
LLAGSSEAEPCEKKERGGREYRANHVNPPEVSHKEAREYTDCKP